MTACNAYSGLKIHQFTNCTYFKHARHYFNDLIKR